MEKFPSINGLRAISVFIVILSHLFINNILFTDLNGSSRLLPFVRFLQEGQIGVAVFFVISGFLITSLMLHEESKTNTVSLKKFYIRRSLRIFPAYFFLLFVYFILQSFDVIYISKDSWITSLTYTKYFNWQLDWYTSHFWSLSIEEQFYIIWPLIFLFGKRFRKVSTILIILMVPLLRNYHFHHNINGLDNLSFFLRIDSIATGCLFALYKNQILNILSKRWDMFFYSSLIGLFLLPDLPLLLKPLQLDIIFAPLGVNSGTLANYFIAVIMMYSIFVKEGNWFYFLNLKWVNYIGLLSYSLYLWQQFYTYTHISWDPYSKDNWVYHYPQNLILIILSALFSYYIIEKPFLKLKDYFSA